MMADIFENKTMLSAPQDVVKVAQASDEPNSGNPIFPRERRSSDMSVQNVTRPRFGYDY